MNHDFESFQFMNDSSCDFDKDLDQANNIYNRVLPSCKYYDELQFNVLTKNKPMDCQQYILMRVVSMQTFLASYILCKDLTLVWI